MPLPSELAQVPENTAVVGDLDEFIAHVESGQAAIEWQMRLEKRVKDLKEVLEEQRTRAD